MGEGRLPGRETSGDPEVPSGDTGGRGLGWGARRHTLVVISKVSGEGNEVAAGPGTGQGH